MPWSDYPSAIRQFSGLIQSAAEARYGAAATSQIIAAAADAADIKLGFSDYTGIARLYGDFVEGRNTRASIASTVSEAQRLGTEQGITSSMIYSPPWSPSLSGGLSPQYVLVRADWTKDTPFGPVTGIFSHQYHVSELHGVLGLLSDLQAQADLAPGDTNSQGATVTGIRSMEYVNG